MDEQPDCDHGSDLGSSPPRFTQIKNLARLPDRERLRTLAQAFSTWAWDTWEDDRMWQLFAHPGRDLNNHGLQIIKALKHGPQYADYWPDARKEEYILAALNAFPAVLTRLEQLENGDHPPLDDPTDNRA